MVCPRYTEWEPSKLIINKPSPMINWYLPGYQLIHSPVIYTRHMKTMALKLIQTLQFQEQKEA